MEISCGFPPGPEVVAHARLAEELGYRRVWLYDSPALYPDVWVSLARVAEATERIGLGPAVLVPNLRHVLVQANAIATVADLAPGRLVVAIGTGFTGRMALGQPALRWGWVEEYVRQLRGLLRGEAVEVDGALVQLMPPEGYLPPAPIDVPILIGANGPKGLKVARELGDGVMTIGGAQPEFDWCAVLAFGTVLDPGEDAGSARAIAAAGPMAAVVYHGIYETSPADLDGLPGGAAWRAVVEAIPPAERHLRLHEDHFVNLTERDRPVIDGDALRMFSWTGEAAELRARLDALEQAGATEILFAPGGPDIARELRTFRAMAVA
jgi:5,10-methylenetetrahydromethanopterin reductase